MREFRGRRYWLVGASEGLGLALARLLSEAGVEVILSARSEVTLKTAAASLPGPATILPVDVGSTDSVSAAAAQLPDLDGMVFLAGVYWPMRAQGWDAKAAEAMADIITREFKAPWVKISIAKLGALRNVKRLGVTIERGKRS